MPSEPDQPWSTEVIHSLTAWTLVQAYHTIARGFTDMFGGFGLSPTQFGVLAQLSIEPALIQSELARRVLIRPQSVGELIKSLVDRGLVQRTEDAGRGRARIVTLTPAGRDLLDAVIPPLLRFNEPASLGLQPDEAATLNALLHKVIETQSPSSHHQAARDAGDRR